MSKKRRKKKAASIDPHDVADGIIDVTAFELVKLIHRVNPTGRSMHSNVQQDRYRLKARLQSLLINRYEDSLVIESAGDTESDLVSIRLLHYDDDGCHALLSELDVDARSRCQRQLDLATLADDNAQEGKRSEPGNRRTTREGNSCLAIETKDTRDTSIADLLSMSERALDAYDYDECERYLRAACSKSDKDPRVAASLLDFLVNTIADYDGALALVDTFPRAWRKNECLRNLTAAALMRSGRIKDALSVLGHSVDRANTDIHERAVLHFIDADDGDRAQAQLSILRSFDDPELSLRIGDLEGRITDLKRRQLQPLVDELHTVWNTGDLDNARKRADKLLAQWPENNVARRIVAKIDRITREREITDLLSRADAAREKFRFKREADLLEQIIRLGGASDERCARLEHARRKEAEKKAQAAVDMILQYWCDGQKREALEHYCNLDDDRRQDIAALIDDRHFLWTNRMLQSPLSRNYEKLVKLAMRVHKLESALETKSVSEKLLAAVERHEPALQRVNGFDTLLNAARDALARVTEAAIDHHLRSARQYLESQDPISARKVLSQLKIGACTAEQRHIHDGLQDRLLQLECIRDLSAAFDDAIDRHDYLAAKKHAIALSKHTAPEMSEKWKKRAEELTESIAESWSLTTSDVDNLPVHTAFNNVTELLEDGNCGISDNGNRMIFVTSHYSWLFIRIFDISQQRFTASAVMCAPMRQELPLIRFADDSLWIVGQDGYLLEFSLDPIQPKHCFDLRDHAGKNRWDESLHYFPEARCAWFRRRDERGGDDNLYIIDIDKQQCIRKLKVMSSLKPFKNNETQLVAVSSKAEKSIFLYTGRGHLECTVPWSHGLHTGVIQHPSGAHCIMTHFGERYSTDTWLDDQFTEEVDYQLKVSMVQTDGTITDTFDLPNSHGELSHKLLRIPGRDLVVVRYIDDSSDDTESLLTVLRCGDNAFEHCYTVTMPPHTAIAYDDDERGVYVTCSDGTHIRCLAIDDRIPNFGNAAPVAAPRPRPTYLNLVTMCDHPTGALSARINALTAEETGAISEALSALLVRIDVGDEDGPDEIAMAAVALERNMALAASSRLVDLLKTRYPDSFWAVYYNAQTQTRRDWKHVINLLASVDVTTRDDGTARHVCHVLGMAHLACGDPNAALDALRTGTTFTAGKCQLDPYIATAEALLMADKDLAEKASTQREYAFVHWYRNIDRLLAGKQWREAVDAMNAGYWPGRMNCNHQLRLAEAWLHIDCKRGSTQWFEKIVALFSLQNPEERKMQSECPIHTRTSTGAPIVDPADVGARAKKWLDAQKTYRPT